MGEISMSWIRFYKIYCYLFLFGLCSCEMDMELGTEEEEVDRRYLYECLGHGECLPTVKVHANSQSVSISWSSSGFNDHRFYLSCEGGGCNEFGSVGANGSWDLDIPSRGESCIIRYVISCDSYYCEDCMEDGSFKISSDGTVEECSHYDCFKEYYSYGISGSYDVILKKSDNQYPPDLDYMDVDMVDAYEMTSDPFNPYKRVGGPTMRKFGYDEIVISDLPKEQGKHYQIVLRNSACLMSESEHYIYFTYYATSSDIVLSPTNVMYVNGHY